jgi:hypothetical protein
LGGHKFLLSSRAKEFEPIAQFGVVFFSRILEFPRQAFQGFLETEPLFYHHKSGIACDKRLLIGKALFEKKQPEAAPKPFRHRGRVK